MYTRLLMPLALALALLAGLAPPAAASLSFSETGQGLEGAFASYWQRHGGLRQFGYPISPPVYDSEGRIVQWLERARFEYHADLPAGQRVLLGLLGRETTAGREGEAAFQRVDDPGDGTWFEATGHTLRGGFRSYWVATGGLPVYGYPISEEFEEVNPADGQSYTVQYFERNRFEHHPEHTGTPYEIQFGLLGRQLYAGRGEPAPAPPDDAPPGLATRRLSPAAPLRVYVGGDSFAPWLSYDLRDLGRRDGLLAVRLDYRISSGLCLPSFFDWPARLRQVMSEPTPPEAVVLFIGANDVLTMQTGNGRVSPRTAAWRAEYARRAGEAMDIVGKGGARLYWVGMPVMREPWRNAIAADVNAAVAEAAADRPWVERVDIWTMFAGPDGSYTRQKRDANGRLVEVRQEDGVHLTRVASTWVAAAVYAQMRRDWVDGLALD